MWCTRTSVRRKPAGGSEQRWRKTQIVARTSGHPSRCVVARSHNAQHPLSTRSRRVGHSFGDACCCFDEFTRPASFLQRYKTNKTEYTGSHRWGDDRRDTRHNEHTTLQSSRNSQACLLTTMQAKWYNIKCSHLTTLI